MTNPLSSLKEINDSFLPIQIGKPMYYVYHTGKVVKCVVRDIQFSSTRNEVLFQLSGTTKLVRTLVWQDGKDIRTKFFLLRADAYKAARELNSSHEH